MNTPHNLTPNQMAARTAVMLTLASLSPEEADAIVLPYSKWPQSLRDKAGTLGALVQAEDAQAEGSKPSQGE